MNKEIKTLVGKKITISPKNEPSYTGIVTSVQFHEETTAVFLVLDNRVNFTISIAAYGRLQKELK